MRARVKTRKNAPSAPSVEDLFKSVGALALLATTGAGELPPVLTAKAVAAGMMPPLGHSALPETIAAAIPPSFRYWTAKSADEARDVRDELVESGIIAARDVLKVDGDLRRVVWKAFLAVEGAEPAPLAKRSPVPTAALKAVVQPEAGEVTMYLAGTESTFDEAGLSEALAAFGAGGDFIAVLADTGVTRAIAAKSAKTAFTIATRPGFVFCSSLPLRKDAHHVEAVRVEASKAHAVRLLRKSDDEVEGGTAPAPEERFVFGVVLEPDVVDSQNDTYSAEEVRKAAHRFMEQHAQLGQQHATIVTGKLKILESYVAPVDFAIGGHAIKSGTWLLAIRVVDDVLWESVKAGSFTGFSIGGSAIRQPT